jgi:aromatic ring-opening dioxygenase LigB subunit
MLVFAGITPHTPLLIPTIGKENLKAMNATTKALERLAQDVFLAGPDTILVISSHATQYPDAFAINLHDAYTIEFKDFGDLSTSQTIHPDVETITQIQRAMRERQIPLTLDSSPNLDYGTGVPLTFLLPLMSGLQLVPISPSGGNPKDHVQFGSALKDVIDASKKRIAVIASGDLSHALSSTAPLAYRPEGQQYDDSLMECVKAQSLVHLLRLDESVIAQAGQCLHEQALILFGLLEKRHTRPEILSYEHPFGVGYLVAEFHLADL